MAKDGAPFSAKAADSVGIYFFPYTGTAFQFEPAASRLTLKGDIACDGAGVCTSTLVGEGDAYATNFSSVNGLIVIYGRDETVGSLPARVALNMSPFAGLLETGAGVDYVSAANHWTCCQSPWWMSPGCADQRR